MADLPVQRDDEPALAPSPGPLALAEPADLIASLPAAVVVVGLDSRVVHWSEGATRLYGWTAQEAVGRSVRELILVGEEERADEVKARTHAGGQWDGDFRARHKDGSTRVVSVSNAPLRDASGQVVGVVGVSIDLTKQAQERELARRQTERLADRNARLVQVSEALGGALTPAQVVQVVLDQCVEALGADAGGVALVEGDRLRVLGSIGYEPAVVATYEALPLEAVTPLTDLLRVRTPLITERREQLVERYPHLPHSSLSHSFAGIPLEVDGRAVGVMALSAARDGAFPSDELDFLLTLGRQCAQALERGRLFAAEREGRRRASLLSRASERLAESLDDERTLEAVVELAVPVLGHWCSVHLLDEDGVPRLAGLRHRDPDLQALLEELFERYPPQTDRGSGIGQAVGEGRTVHHRTFPPQVLQAVARDEEHLAALHRLGLGSALVVPLRSGGRVLGVLTLASERADRYDDADVQLAEDLARRMATAVDNALHFREQRETALTLQRSLLPSRLPVLPGLQVAHRYLPGTAGAEVGGDWYDLLALAGGAVGVVIGDVMGRGVAAAAVMGQLRATVRACALAEPSPGAVLALVDAALSSLEQSTLATCLYGVLDPSTRRLRLASAGHLPPLVLHPGGGAEYLELEPGPPLGVGLGIPREVEVELPEGASLLLFTDGLVEGRHQPVEEGLHALRAAVSGLAEVPVEELCDRVLAATGRDGRPDDDSALLVVGLGAVPAPVDAAAHLHLAGHLSEVARARHLAEALATEAGVDRHDAALLTTELASNALRHGGPGVDLWIRRLPHGLRVEIVDGRSAALPQVQAPDDDAEGGRGLVLVEALARRWGSERLSAGKSVWFELAPPEGEDA